MTSTVSNNTKFNPLLHNWKCGVRSKTKIATLLLALHITAAPMVVISFIANIYNRGMSGDMVSMFFGIGAATTGIAGVIGIFIAIDSFSCLNTKSYVDMKLSLPMTASGRFLSNFFAGFTAYAAPFLTAQVISVLGMLYGLIFMDGRTFETIGGHKDGEPVFVPYVCEYFGEFLPALLKLILCGVLVMLMMYTLAVFVAVCCGNKFESIAYTVLINILIPMTTVYVISAMFDGLFGIEIYQKLVNILTFTSPAGGAFGALDRCFADTVNSGFLFGYNNKAISGLGLWAAVYFLITAALFGVSFLLYKKRRADQVSKPFAFKFLYHIISFVTVLLIYSLFYLDEHKATLPAVVTTLIVYIVMEFAVNRGFKRVWLSAVKYAGTIGFSILLLFTAQKTEGFGAVERVPDISKVESVELQNYGGFYGMFDNGSYYYTDSDGNDHSGNTLVFSEQENIQTILNAHQSLVNKRKDDKNYVNGGINIVYTLKNGTTLERFYNGLPAEEAEILSRIDLSDEFKTQTAEKEKWYILNTKERLEKNVENWERKSQIEAASSANVITFDDKFSYGHTQTQPIIPLFKRGFYDRLAEAYSADIMDITEENYYLSDSVNLYGSFYGEQIFIPESFTRTLKVYEDFGFEVTDRRDISDTENLKNDLQIATKGSNNESNIKIYTADEWREANDVPDGTRLHGSYNSQYAPRDYYELDGDYYIYDIDDNFVELYRNMQPMNIVPDDGYIIYVSGKTAVVPKELNGIAKKVAAERQPSKRDVPETVEVPIQYYD